MRHRGTPPRIAASTRTEQPPGLPGRGRCSAVGGQTPGALLEPRSRWTVDKWHMVALANQMVTEVRQRVTRQQLGRRGTTADPVRVNRQLLLTGADHLTAKQWARLNATSRAARRPATRRLPGLALPPQVS